MFQLTLEEVHRLRSQSVILDAEAVENKSEFGARRHGSLRSQDAILDGGRGRHRKYLPYAFTEQGVAMLSSVLRSPRAVQVNVEIMRAFVRLRQLLQGNAELARKLDELEKRYDAQFSAVFVAIRQLMAPPNTEKKRIGFET